MSLSSLREDSDSFPLDQEVGLSECVHPLMFEDSLPLSDTYAADATRGHVVRVVRRCIDARRFVPDLDAVAFAYELWMLGHGACMLFVEDDMSYDQVEPLVQSGLVRLYSSAGDLPDMAASSLTEGWSRVHDDR